MVTDKKKAIFPKGRIRFCKKHIQQCKKLDGNSRSFISDCSFQDTSLNIKASRRGQGYWGVWLLVTVLSSVSLQDWPWQAVCKGFSRQAQSGAVHEHQTQVCSLWEGLQPRMQAPGQGLVTHSHFQLQSPHPPDSYLSSQADDSFRYLRRGPLWRRGPLLVTPHPAFSYSEVFPFPLPSTSGSTKLPEPSVCSSTSPLPDAAWGYGSMGRKGTGQRAPALLLNSYGYHHIKWWRGLKVFIFVCGF